MPQRGCKGETWLTCSLAAVAPAKSTVAWESVKKAPATVHRFLTVPMDFAAARTDTSSAHPFLDCAVVSSAFVGMGRTSVAARVRVDHVPMPLRPLPQRLLSRLRLQARYPQTVLVAMGVDWHAKAPNSVTVAPRLASVARLNTLAWTF